MLKLYLTRTLYFCRFELIFIFLKKAVCSHEKHVHNCQHNLNYYAVFCQPILCIKTNIMQNQLVVSHQPLLIESVIFSNSILLPSQVCILYSAHVSESPEVEYNHNSFFHLHSPLSPALSLILAPDTYHYVPKMY